jgi:DUF1680 family protein
MLWLVVAADAPVSAGNASAAAAPRDYAIQPVPFTAVRVNDAFWTPRLETNRQTTVWYCFQKCEETGRIDNFAKAGGLKPGTFQGCPFDDSDVFKVIQGAAYTLATHPDPKLDAYLDELIAKIAAAQETDGYLYTARTFKSGHSRAGKDRWLNERGAQTSCAAGCFAVERGPLVYCAEGADNSGKVLGFSLAGRVSFSTEARPGLLGGVVGVMATSDGQDNAGLTLIPYYAWCHRGPNEMQVWFPSTASVSRP